MQDETRKIMHLPELAPSRRLASAYRFTCTFVAVSAEFEAFGVSRASREALAKRRAWNWWRTAEQSVPHAPQRGGKINCQVGRVRLDCAFENGLSFWVSRDQSAQGAH